MFHGLFVSLGGGFFMHVLVNVESVSVNWLM